MFGGHWFGRGTATFRFSSWTVTSTWVHRTTTRGAITIAPQIPPGIVVITSREPPVVTVIVVAKWPPTVIVDITKRSQATIAIVVSKAPPVLVISIVIITAIRPPAGLGVPKVVEVNHEVLEVLPNARDVAVIISARATRSTEVGREILATIRDLMPTCATSAQTLSLLHHSAVLARHIACCCILQGDIAWNISSKIRLQ